MSFFYDLNKKLNGIGAEEKKLVESKQAPQTPARQTLEQALRSDLKTLMEDGTGGINFSGSGSLEEKVGYSAKKAAAGKDIGKPGKNFAKIEKSAGGGEKGKRIAGAVLNKLRHANEEIADEGNEFSGALANAKKDHKSEFTVGGKTFPVQENGMEESALQAYLGNKKYGKEGMDALRKAGREHASKEKMDNIRNQYDKMDEAEMECDTPTPSKGIPGNVPLKDKMKRLNKGRDYYEADENEEDIMDYLNRKLAPFDKKQAKEDAVSKPYNGSAGDADAYNGMEFEGNAFTGKLKSTPKGEKFSVGGKEYTDTSELDETMTRQHFQHTADLLKHIEDPAKRMELAKHHAGIFKASNPRFDHGKFMKACNCDEGLVGAALGGAAGALVGGPVGAVRGAMAGNTIGNAISSNQSETEVEEGWDDMDKWLAQREKEKGTGKFDKRQVSTGTVYTRRFDDEPEDDDADAPASKGGKPVVKRGRGRPAGTKGATGARGPTGKSKLMAKDAMREEELEELSPDTLKRYIKKASGSAASKGLSLGNKMAKGDEVDRYTGRIGMYKKDDENDRMRDKVGASRDEIEKLTSKTKARIGNIGKAVDRLGEEDVAEVCDHCGQPIQEKAVSKKQQKFMGMVHAAQKGEKPASEEVAKVAKGMKKKDAEDFASTKHKGLPEKVKAKKTEEGAKPDFLDVDKDGDKKETFKKAVKDKKEKKVDETTTSGSVATASEAPKSSKGGIKFGGGIYDSWNRTIENMINENVNVNTTTSKNDDGQDHESITISVDGDDVSRFKELLQSMGIAQNHSHGDSTHSAEPCGTCGGVPCQCDELAEADAPVSQNEPDYPTNQEESDDALQYSGGPNDPKSTGQTTVPVVASQEDRLHTMEESVDSFLNLYQAFKTK